MPQWLLPKCACSCSHSWPSGGNSPCIVKPGLCLCNVMSVAKGGPKLCRSQKEGDKEIRTVVTGGVECDGCSMADLAEAMATAATALIVNETGLEDRYDFPLNCSKYKEFSVPIPGSRQADYGTGVRSIDPSTGPQARDAEAVG